MLKGSIVALVTPMADDGALDFAALTRLIEYHIDNGTEGLVVLGTTGEAMTLTFEQQLQVIDATLTTVAGRISVYVGNGSNNTALIVERLKQLDTMGFDGYLTVTPYYNNPTQRGMIAHFSEVARHTQKPMLLYNVPGRTSSDLLPQTVATLAEIDNIVGIKEATGELSRLAELKTLCGEDFICLSGDDASALEFMRLGGDGVISVTANVAPMAMAQMCRLALAGEYQQAERINHRLALLHQRLFIESNPVPAKWALHHMGLINSPMVRLPLVCLEPIHQNAVQEALIAADLTF